MIRHGAYNFCHFIGLIVLFFWGSVNGKWLDLGEKREPAPPKVELEYHAETIEGTVIVPGMFLENHSREDPSFSEIVIPGEGTCHHPEHPKLPIIYRLITVNAGASVSVEIHHKNPITLGLETAGITNPLLLAPSNDPVLRNSRVPSVLRKSDPNNQPQDQFFPEEIVRVTGGGVMRGERFYRLEIAPVQYNPVGKCIRFYSKIKFTITIHSTSQRTDRSFKPILTPPFQHILDNPLSASKSQKKESMVEHSEVLGYLLIVDDPLIDGIKPWVQWKKECGFDVQMKTLSEVGNEPVQIKQTVQWAYETGKPPPTYLLLVGDTDRIPTFAGKRALNPKVPHGTDLFYATMDGETDVFPDLLVGRLSAREPSQVRIIVDKWLTYERLSVQQSDWLQRTVFIATKDSLFHELVEDGARRTILNYFAPHHILCDSVWTAYDGTAISVQQLINQGCALVNYSGHGSEFYWDDLSQFSVVDIYGLTNQDRYPLVFSFGCNSGDFSEIECLGESWLRYQDRGASMFFGATGLAFWYEDDYLNEKIFDRAFNSHLRSIGEIIGAALLDLYTRGYPYAEYYYEIYHLLGDPSSLFWFGAPETLQVQFPDTVAANTKTFDVGVTDHLGEVDQAMIGVNQGGALLGSAWSNHGKGSFDLNSPVTQDPELLLTVTKEGYRPVQDTLFVPDKPELIFKPDSIPIDKETPLELTVIDIKGLPLSNIEVHILGWGVSGDILAVTNDQGVADFRLISPYGQVLTIIGKTLSGQNDFFIEDLKVFGGISLVDSQYSVAVESLELIGFLVPGFEGKICIETEPTPEIIYLTGCGLDTSSTSGCVHVNPSSEGELNLVLGRRGYQLTEIGISVKKVYGFLEGHVMQCLTNKVLENIRVSITEPSENQVLSVFSDSMGYFAFQDSFQAGWASITVNEQPYQPFQELFLLGHGQNIQLIELEPKRPAVISGRALLEGSINHSGIQVFVLSQAVCDTTSRDGRFLLSGVIPDSIQIRAVKEGFVSEVKDLIVTVGEVQNGLEIFLKRGINEINEDFERGEGGFKTISGQWEWGKPGPGLYQRGPESAHSGDHVWATVLDGDYSQLAHDILESPEISLVGFQKPLLEFFHYYQMDHYNQGFDGGNIKISNDSGDTWNLLTVEGGYPVDSLSKNNLSLGGEPAFSGFIDDWEKVRIDLSGYEEQHVFMRFFFGSTEKIEDVGWYIDDFMITEMAAKSAPDRKILCANYPNPFRMQTVIHFKLIEDCIVSLKIYNILGQELRWWDHHPGKSGDNWIVWDGKTPSGLDLPTGIYVIEINTGDWWDRQKMILLR